MPDETLQAETGRRARPVCPRCGSDMVLIGRLADRLGNAVFFSVAEGDGFSRALGTVRSCYCNDCGEVVLTIE
jgi:ribosomal protein S27AE